jgi:hypothetical protein
MVLQEALIGGTVYLEYVEEEMSLPEMERVAFEYRALTNREKIDLLHRTTNSRGVPNGGDVCAIAVKKIRNLAKADGTPLDTVEKILSYSDKDNSLAYMLFIVGSIIWRRQGGESINLKN